MDNETRELIIKYAVKNARDYGTARAGTVISKVLSEKPELKNSMKEFAREVNEIVAEVNAYSKEKLGEEYGKYADEFDVAAKEKAEKTAKPNISIAEAVMGEFTTRFPPEPNGYMHIGHTKAAFLERELTDKYDGKMVLFFDDTNPEKERQEFVDAIKRDLKWLGITFDSECYASDSVEKMYGFAETAMREGNAYVCNCSADEIKKGREKGIGCVHKTQGTDASIAMWKDMLNGAIKEGAIVRLNGDMKSLNTVMRDPTLFRIKEGKHYRQGEKYRVWPTYNFSTPIMDSLNGMTDIIRSKEYELRDELYDRILDMLALRKPRVHTISRLEILNNVTSKRTLNAMIDEGVIKNYDDPRLITVSALRRRGIRPEAIREFALSFGMGKANTKVSLQKLLDINRRIVEGDAIRLFFMENPVEMRVSGTGKEGVEVTMKANRNGNEERKYVITDSVYVDKNEQKNLTVGSLIRLKDAFNVQVEKSGTDNVSAEYKGTEPTTPPRVAWMEKQSAVKCKLLIISDLLDGEKPNSNGITEIDGLIEGFASRLKEGQIVDIDKRGLFKFDDRKDMVFISL